jgi:hypothetical protein
VLSFVGSDATTAFLGARGRAVQGQQLVASGVWLVAS